eukprot:3186125-Amphidinium_carterae.2
MKVHLAAHRGRACWLNQALTVSSALIMFRLTSCNSPACCNCKSSTTPTRPTDGCCTDIRMCKEDMYTAARAVARGQPAVTDTCTLNG